MRATGSAGGCRYMSPRAGRCHSSYQPSLSIRLLDLEGHDRRHIDLVRDLHDAHSEVPGADAGKVVADIEKVYVAEEEPTFTVPVSVRIQEARGYQLVVEGQEGRA